MSVDQADIFKYFQINFIFQFCSNKLFYSILFLTVTIKFSIPVNSFQLPKHKYVFIHVIKINRFKVKNSNFVFLFYGNIMLL